MRKPEYIFLDCHTKGNRCDPKFWIDLLPSEFPGKSDGWLSDDVSLLLNFYIVFDKSCLNYSK